MWEARQLVGRARAGQLGQARAQESGGASWAGRLVCWRVAGVGRVKGWLGRGWRRLERRAGAGDHGNALSTRYNVLGIGNWSIMSMHSVWRFKPGWAFWIVYFSVDWFKSTSSMHIKAVREGKWTLIHMKQCLFWWFETKGKKKAVFLVRLFAWLLEFLFDGLNLFLFLTRTTVYFQYLGSACSYAQTVRFLLLLTCFDKRWWLIFVILYLDASAWQENLALTMIIFRSLLPLTAKGCREKHRTIHDLTRASGRNNS